MCCRDVDNKQDVRQGHTPSAGPVRRSKQGEDLQQYAAGTVQNKEIVHQRHTSSPGPVRRFKQGEGVYISNMKMKADLKVC